MCRRFDFDLNQTLSDDCWPIGTPQRLSHPLAKRIFDLISTSTTSIYKLRKTHPELPNYRQLYHWKAKISLVRSGLAAGPGTTG